MARLKKLLLKGLGFVVSVKEKEEAVWLSAMHAQEMELLSKWHNLDQECILKFRFLAKNARQQGKQSKRKTNARVVKGRRSSSRRRR